MTDIPFASLSANDKVDCLKKQNTALAAALNDAKEQVKRALDIRIEAMALRAGVKSTKRLDRLATIHAAACLEDRVAQMECQLLRERAHNRSLEAQLKYLDDAYTNLETQIAQDPRGSDDNVLDVSQASAVSERGLCYTYQTPAHQLSSNMARRSDPSLEATDISHPDIATEFSPWSDSEDGIATPTPLPRIRRVNAITDLNGTGAAPHGQT